MYSRLEKLIKSFDVLEKAREFYSKDINFDKVLDSMITLAINYNLLGEYDVALERFQEIEKRFYKNNLSSEKLAILYHNLGYTYYNKELYDDALKYLEMSLSIKEIQSINRSYIKTYYLYTLTNVKLNAHKEIDSTVLQMFDEGNKFSSQIDSIEYNLKFTFQKLIYQNTDAFKLIEFIENDVLPYFGEKGDRDDYKFFFKTLGDLYYQEKRYKMASDCLYKYMEI